jgi:pyruvate carboxylase subunit B
VRYVAVVNGSEYTVSADRSGVDAVTGGVTICDTSHSVHLENIEERVGTADALFCLFIDGAPHEVFAEWHGNSYHITIDGTRYDVQVEEEQLHRLGEWRGERDRPGSDIGEATVISPMPGIVVDVLVEEGQVVQAGDRLAILEAMKMENDLRAPCAGIVESVHVVPGQTVNLKDVILSIGAPPGREDSTQED